MRVNFQNVLNGGMKQPWRIINVILHLPQIIRLQWRLLIDRRVALHLKIILIAAVIYAISPLDLLPDFALPVIGYADDLLIMIAAMKYFLRNIPQHILDEHVRQMGGDVSNYK
ncbi:DUF1232 domain-containing protein [candidate division KSB1 bacterium]|nr:DUF1232 domain-containing protein [candidate division KSB1 bacterium]